MAIVYGSVCSGIEAASVAWAPFGWRPAFLSDIEAFPRAVLAHHYPDVPLHGRERARGERLEDYAADAGFQTIGADDYDAIDLLVGGTPCQSFSVAGLRKGLDDDRGNLALEYLRLAGRTRPRWVVWENVPGVLSIDEGRAFGAILGGMAALGYGFAYRVLDAQYVRVDGYGRAVPQRRRRVFVVGYLGDWRRAAAVLFESESLRGDPPPRREAGESAAYDVAPCLAASGRGFERTGDTRGQDCLIAAPVAATLNAHFGDKQGLEDQHFNQGCPNFIAFHGSQDPDLCGGHAHPVGRNQGQETCIAIQERAVADNPASGPDGSGVRTDGAAYTLEARTVPQAVAFDTTQITNPNNRSRAASDLPCHPLAATAHPPAVAHALHAEGFDASEDGTGRGTPLVPDTAWRVRRLTPRECERLQGFPDDYTMIPWRGKPAGQCPDGPRYRALGNSMAVNVMRWLGRRIEMVEGLDV